MIVVKNQITRKIKAKDIHDGTTFTGRISDYPPRLFLKMSRFIIPLDGSLADYWDKSSIDVLEILDYQEVDLEITIVQQLK